MNKSALASFALLALFAGCTNNPVGPDQTQVVLQGYLYAHEPVSDIQVATSMAIGGSDSVENPITNASVILTKNGTAYKLSPNSAQPGYYSYPGSDLTVGEGDSFSIEIDAAGRHISATTVVPPKPQQLALSMTTLRFQADSIRSTFAGTRTRLVGLDSGVVSWSNPAGDFYFVVIESVDPNRQLMRPDTLFTRRFISQPTDQSTYMINNNSILYTGLHVLRLYRVNKEYADLYRSRLQDSRTLNEPLTNVQNGLGIFSAFASDSLYFNAVMN